MANGFGSLYVGSSGLQSAQNALNVTANNLANVDTKGYVRQQVRFADKNYSNLKLATPKTAMQQSGLGVSIGDVVHARDIFLDKAFRTETGRYGFYSTMYENVSNVEDMFQELHGEEFKESIDDLWSAFQELAKDSMNSTNQNLVVQKSELFISRCNSLYSDLKSYQNNLNDQIYDDIQTVNDIGKQIYQLNNDIIKVESGGQETAMTLRDQRDALLDQLAGYGNVTASEDQFGAVTVTFENIDFVDDNRCYEIQMKADKTTGFYTPYWGQLSDVDSGEYVPVFRMDRDISSEFNTDVGKIKALMVSRGTTYGKYSDLDDETSYKTIENNTVMEAQAQIDKLFHSIATGINDILCPNTELQTAITTTDGQTYAAGTRILDVDNYTLGEDKQLPPQELFSRIGCDRYTTVTGTDGKTYYIYNEEDMSDTSKQYMIGSTKINPEIQAQITKLPVYTQNGAVDYELGKKLTALWEAKDMTINPYDNTPCTFQNYYNKVVDMLGNAGNVYSSATDTLSNTVESVDNQRSQVTGVASDEELTHMVKFQSAYNAASRFITVISEMTELIVTGLI